MSTLVKVLIVLAVLAVLAIGTCVVGGFLLATRGLDFFVKLGIEQGGSAVLGVETTVDAVDLQLSNQRLELTGLNIANPVGFTATRFLSFGTAAASFDGQASQAGVITLPELTFDDIDLFFERTPSGSNYNTILDNINTLVGSGSGSSGSTPTGTTGDATEFIINAITITDVDVTARMLGTGNQAIDDAGEVNITIPEIVLRDVGTAADPISGTELTALLVQTLIQSTIDVGGAELPTEMLQDLQNKLGELPSLQELGVGELENLGQQMQDTVDEAVQGAQDAVNDAVDEGRQAIEEGLQNLLPGQQQNGGN